MQDNLHVEIKADSEQFIPKYQNPGDAGADLRSSEHRRIQPGEVAVIDCGFSIAVPKGWVGLIHPRSGLASILANRS